MIVLRNRARGVWVMAALNLLVLAAFAYRWIQGDPRLGIRIFTLAAAVLLVLKARALIRPVELRLVDGRLSGRAGLGGAFSTSRDNVLRLEAVDGGLLLEFKDLAAVEAPIRKLESVPGGKPSCRAAAISLVGTDSPEISSKCRSNSSGEALATC